MALVLADRVQETTTTTGTGSITLGGAVPGFQSFAVVGNTNTCYYTIVDASAWEVGIGTYSTTGPTLARTTILSNSLGTLVAITLTAGTKNVFLTYPAERAITGPSSSIANSVALFDSTSGNIIKDSAAQDGLIYGLTVGRGAGSIATNTAVGASALAGSNTGTGYNNAFGSNALQSNTSGDYNSGFGAASLSANTTGSYNTGLGYGALGLNTTASYNTAVGFQASYTNQTGAETTALGWRALYLNTGNHNTGIGSGSFYNNSTGTENTGVGKYSGFTNTTGAYNTALGRDALFSNVTASNNTAVGYQAGYTNTGTGHVFVGYRAGYANSTGVYNTFVGYNAGTSVATGSKNVIIGSYTGLGAPISATGSNYIVFSDGDANVRGYFNNTGVLNIASLTASAAVFTDASKNLSSGTLPITYGGTGQITANAAFNALVPSQTGNSGKYLTTDGTDTSWATNAGGDVVGPASATANGIVLFDSTTGKIIKDSAATNGLIYGLTVGRGGGGVSGNTVLGVAALDYNSSGVFNVAIGYQAISLSSSASSNTAIGYQSLLNLNFPILSSGLVVGVIYRILSLGTTSWTSVGASSNTVGVIFTATGTVPGTGLAEVYGSLGASQNTAVGYLSGYAMSGGANNTLMGYASGASITFGNSNTFIGYNSGTSVTTGGKNVIIGSYAGLIAPISMTGSNYIIFSDGDANVRGYFDSTGNLNVASLTASKPVFTDASKNLVSTGTLGIDQGGTGQITASAAFNALSPITTTGDLIVGNGTNSATRLAIGANGSILTSDGTTASWTAAPATGVTSFSAGTTGFTPSTATTGAVTLAGTLATANGGTGLTSFTANGVVYASSTSALATGSALTFDGTNLGLGTSSYGGSKLAIQNGSILVRTDGDILKVNDVADTTYWFRLTRSGSDLEIVNRQSGAIKFLTSDIEQMRLTSTGLGIGTTSPSTKLHVSGVSRFARSTDASQYLNLTLETGNAVYNAVGSINHVWQNAGTEQMRLDSAGVLGLGVTPAAWGSSIGKTLQINTGGSFSADLANAYFAANSYYNGTNWIYQTSTHATRYTLGSNFHAWYTAPTGTAGNAITFTQAMTLNASGNLLVSTTSDSGNSLIREVAIKGPSNGNARVFVTTNSGVQAQFGVTEFSSSNVGFVGTTTSHPFLFQTNDTERARIDSSGNLLVGTTSLFDAERISVTSALSQRAAYLKNDTAAVTNTLIHNTATSGDNIFVGFGTEATYTGRGSITYNRAGGLVVYNTTSDYRAKDISGSVTNSGSVIDSVPVYMGKMHGATQERPMFIAHETPEYAHTGEKDAVDADGNPVYQQMDASALIPVMWAEIQSLRKRLADAGI